MSLETLLPAMQEMNGRLEGIAQLLANQAQSIQTGEILQREVVRLQQQLVDLQKQPVRRAPGGQPNAAQSDQVVAYLNEILKEINALAGTTQQQAQAGYAPGTTQVEVHFEEIRPLLEDIKERLGDLATGLPASKDEYVDRQREQFVDDLYEKQDVYSKMQTPPQSPKPAPKPTTRPPYSSVERTPPTTPRQTTLWGTGPRTGDQPPTRQSQPSPYAQPPAQSRTQPSPRQDVDPRDAEQMDAIFSEEATYLDERKAHLDKEEKYFEERKEYLEERKDHITQKKSWYLNFG